MKVDTHPHLTTRIRLWTCKYRTVPSPCPRSWARLEVEVSNRLRLVNARYPRIISTCSVNKAMVSRWCKTSSTLLRAIFNSIISCSNRCFSSSNRSLPCRMPHSTIVSALSRLLTRVRPCKTPNNSSYSSRTLRITRLRIYLTRSKYSSNSVGPACRTRRLQMQTQICKRWPSSTS